MRATRIGLALGCLVVGVLLPLGGASADDLSPCTGTDVSPLVQCGRTTRVSVASDGTQANKTWGASYHPAISADGRYVAFQSFAVNLVPGDTNGAHDIFVRDRANRQTTRVSVSSAGVQAASRASSYAPSISADGRYVAFTSTAANLVSGDTNDMPDTFVHDRLTAQTTRVSVASDGAQSNYGSWSTTISADGRYVAFVSSASNLVPDDTNGLDAGDVFVHDRLSGATSRVSVASDGTQADSWNYDPAMSADGRYVTFTSRATTLVPGDTNRASDVFVHDRVTGQTTRESLGASEAEANGMSESGGLAISADGRYVTFTSYASNLVPEDPEAWDVFVRDRRSGETTRLTAGSTYFGISRPAISADGRFVTFAADLPVASGLGFEPYGDDVFVHNRLNDQTARISGVGGTPANGFCWEPALSADGRFVTFASEATNLVVGDTNETYDIFVHDRRPNLKGA